MPPNNTQACDLDSRVISVLSEKFLQTVVDGQVLIVSLASVAKQQCWCRMTGSQLFRNAESRHAEILPVQDFPTRLIERDVL